MLADLKMPGTLEAVDSVLSDADGGGVTTAEVIERLLGAQITLRNNRRLQAAMRSSRLPVVKTLDEFDFSFQPSIKREQIENLHELGFVERKENVVLLGPPVSERPISRSVSPSRRRRTAAGFTTAPSPSSSHRSRKPEPPVRWHDGSPFSATPRFSSSMSSATCPSTRPAPCSSSSS